MYRIILYFILFSAAVGSAKPALSGDYGIYVATPFLQNENQLLPTDVYRLQGVDGIAIRIPWRIVEPQPGRFDWTLIDRTVEEALRNDKMLSIGIVTGTFSPRWLASQGVEYHGFGFPRQRCVVQSIPIPWDPDYMSAYRRLISALRDHLIEIGALDYVRVIRLGAIAQQTLELRLPRNNRCTTNNDRAWMALGYRPSLVVQAWQEATLLTAHMFPDALLVQAVLEDDGFPAIDENGEPISRRNRTTMQRMVNFGIANFGRRFALQNTALRPNGFDPRRVVDAFRSGASLAFQTNQYRGRAGAGCQRNRRESDRPCTADEYGRMINQARAMGASYIEIWSGDAVHFDDVLLEIE